MNGAPVDGAPADGAPVDVVEVDRVSSVVAGTTVLDGVSLRAGRGRVVVLAGRSGSGKSTLCHLVAGVGRPSSGTVRVLGEPLARTPPWSTVSLLPQRLALVPELTVWENVAWPCLLAGRELPAGLVGDLGLEHLVHQPARATSLGEQQRTALARALAVAPDVAVLDEPTGHQDDANVERVLAALVGAARAGTCVLVATHDQRVIAVADDVVRLQGGRVLGATTPRRTP